MGNNKKTSTIVHADNPARRNQNNKEPEVFDDLALLSISKAASVLRVNKYRIYDLMETNKLKYIDMGGTIKIPYFELKQCIQSLSKFSPQIESSKSEVIQKRIIETTPKDIMKRIRETRIENE